MTWLLYFVGLIAFFCVTERMRGSGASVIFTNKIVIPIYRSVYLFGMHYWLWGPMPTLLDSFVPGIWGYIAAAALCSALQSWGYVYGWGKYFPDGKDTSTEKENTRITGWANTLFKQNYKEIATAKERKAWQTLAMCLRWGDPLVGFAPYVIVTSALFLNPWLLLGIPAYYFCGLCYLAGFSLRPGKPVTAAEYINGLYIGLLHGAV